MANDPQSAVLLEELVAWWQERKAALAATQDASRKTKRQTFHVEQRWLDAIFRQADLDDLKHTQVVNEAFRQYFEGTAHSGTPVGARAMPQVEATAPAQTPRTAHKSQTGVPRVDMPEVTAPPAEEVVGAQKSQAGTPVVDIPVSASNGVPPFPNTQYLGKLCPRGHEHGSTGQSLRRRSSKGCLECDKEAKRLARAGGVAT